MATPKKTETTSIPMTAKDGRPWNAESEAEAMELMARGYSRDDGGRKAPPADGAKSEKSESTKTGGAAPGSKSTGS